jgi:hypothetical protein
MAIVNPPYKAKIIGEGNKLNTAWRSFFESLFIVSGNGSGVMSFSQGGISSFSDIYISSSNDLYIGGIKFVPPTAADIGKVLTIINDNELGYIEGGVDIAVTPTGTMKNGFFGTTPPTGWLLLNDGSIGNTVSGANNRANEDTEDLYVTLWNRVTQTYCPVAGGRGASALADFNAGKTIDLPLFAGSAIGIAGSGSGLTTRATGEVDGDETHTLTLAQLPSHTHDVTDVGSQAIFQSSATTFSKAISTGATSGAAGASPAAAHNNMQPSLFFTGIIKL